MFILSAMKRAAPSRKTECRLTCFGTGDGCPCADRNHAAFLYRLGKTAIQLDCGEPIDKSYKASGISYDEVDGIIISHLHADHFGGFFMLMQGFWLEGRRKPLPVYLPEGGIQPVRQMLHAGFLFDEVLPFPLRFHPLKAAKAISLGEVTVTPFVTSHLEGTRARFEKKYPVEFQAYCFLLESDGCRVGHSGDLGKPADLEPLLAQPLDLLVCELAHFSPEDVFGYLQGREIKHVVWTHVGRPFRQNLAKTRPLAARMLPKMKHTFVTDGQEIVF